MHRFLGSLAPVAGALAVAACGTTSSTPPATSSAATSSGPACASGSISASGSTALQPLVQKAAESFHALCPGATITVSGGGSSAGLANVASGTSDIGNSDVPVKNAPSIDASSVTDHQVAIVVFAVAVNPQAGVSNLTAAQVRDVFAGSVTNWSQVGGANVPITLIERKPGSGTRLSFDKILMKGRTESSTPASTQDSTQLVLTQLGSSPGAVSYLGASSLPKTAGPTAVTLDGVAPAAASLENGTYPFYSHEHMYTKTGASGLVSAFIDYLRSPGFQDGPVKTLGYLPLSTTTRLSAAD